MATERCLVMAGAHGNSQAGPAIFEAYDAISVKTDRDPSHLTKWRLARGQPALVAQRFQSLFRIELPSHTARTVAFGPRDARIGSPLVVMLVMLGGILVGL
jgi:hypothetical protein